MAQFTDRLIRAARLEPQLYEEVEADEGAMGQAMGTVVASSVAAGFGAIVHGGFGQLFGMTVAALVGWFIWAYITYFIGTRLLPEPQTQATPGQLLRTIGFSSAPGLIRILGIIPGITGLVFLVAQVWMLAAMVVAVRQALDYTGTMRAIGVCALGWILLMLISFLLLGWMGGGT